MATSFDLSALVCRAAVFLNIFIFIFIYEFTANDRQQRDLAGQRRAWDSEIRTNHHGICIVFRTQSAEEPAHSLVRLFMLMFYNVFL